MTAMTVAGVMSGTSADGIDVALVRIGAGKDHRPPMRKERALMGHSTKVGHAEFQRPKLTLVAHEAFPYPAALRRAVLAAMNAERTSTAELARLNWRLGMEYARAVRATAEKHGAKVELIGCHGQTLYHQGKPATYAGRSFACTWQAGEPALLAAEMGVPVVSNFRPADMAAGGQGAPLVPLLDYVLFADRERGRVLQNIGGIANLTAIPAGAGPEAVVAFDTGPGNMVMDWLAGELLGKKFDQDGRSGGAGNGDCRGAREGIAQSILQADAAEDGGAGAVWRGVCGAVFEGVPAVQREGGGCAGDGDGADGGDDCARAMRSLWCDG